ncbi:putative sporulation protein YtxC [Bacillus carboniphilus]|uniref:Sporulation protein YtxC n=1 Tax=Bacillus carboniphilus TaxID=86663 RepID=A0ABP3G4R7_9BACI
MFQIHFHDQEEANDLIRNLSKVMSSSIFVQGNNIVQNYHSVIIQYPTEAQDEVLLLLTDSLKQFIQRRKKDEWLDLLLEQQYYYQDPEERQQILYILHSIIDGEKDDLKTFELPNDEDEILETTIREFLLEQSTFFFESFETFRLKPYLEHLMSYLDLAIDEYKMEQEYQAFVSMLRDFLKGRKAKYEKVFLLDQDGFQFFSEEGIHLKRQDLTKLIDRKLLTNHPLYVDSVTIAPLISIAPKQVNIYTDAPDQGMVITLKNIFEEKVNVYKLEQCPFHFV